MSISRQSIEDLKKISKISDFILEATTGKVRGERGMALCPFHGEKTPSLSFTDSNNLYHCFGCKEGGDIYKFVQEIKGIEFAESVEEVAERYNFKLTYIKSDNFTPKKDLIEKLTLLGKYFHEILISSDEANQARAFLRKRGLDKESILNFQIGWIGQNDKDLLNHCKSLNISKKELQQVGLFNSSGRQFFINRILFPVLDNRNNIIAFGGRHIKGSGPKYMNSPETLLYQKRRILYSGKDFNEQAKKEDSIFIFEGYIDVIAASICGINTAVAPCGTSLTNEHLDFLSKFNSELVLCFDNDEAGFEAVKKILNLSIRRDKALDIYVVGFPDNYKDIGEMLEDGKLDEFQRLLDGKSKIVDYVISNEIAQMLKKELRKNEIVYKLLPILNNLSPIEAEESKLLISDRLNIDINTLEAELRGNKAEFKEEKKVGIFSNEFETIFLSELLNRKEDDLDDINKSILEDKDLGLSIKLFELKQHSKEIEEGTLPEYLMKYFTISYSEDEFQEAKNRLYIMNLDNEISKLSSQIELSEDTKQTGELLKSIADLKQKKESIYNFDN